MIFVFLDDNTLDVIEGNLVDMHGEYEAIDVKRGAYRFYDSEGHLLQPNVIEESVPTKFLFITIKFPAISYTLEKTGVNSVAEILTKLNDLAYVNPNKWFANTEAVKAYFRKLETK